jgi:hypothetical protein
VAYTLGGIVTARHTFVGIVTSIALALVVLAGRAGAAYADGLDWIPNPGIGSPFGQNLQFYVALLAFGGLLVVIGLFTLWRLARRTRAKEAYASSRSSGSTDEDPR